MNKLLVAEAVRQRIAGSGKSLNSICSEAFLVRGSVSRHLADGSNLTVDEVCKIADVLGIQAYQFFRTSHHDKLAEKECAA